MYVLIAQIQTKCTREQKEGSQTALAYRVTFCGQLQCQWNRTTANTAMPVRTNLLRLRLTKRPLAAMSYN